MFSPSTKSAADTLSSRVRGNLSDLKDRLNRSAVRQSLEPLETGMATALTTREGCEGFMSGLRGAMRKLPDGSDLDSYPIVWRRVFENLDIDEAVAGQAGDIAAHIVTLFTTRLRDMENVGDIDILALAVTHARASLPGKTADPAPPAALKTTPSRPEAGISQTLPDLPKDRPGRDRTAAAPQAKIPSIPDQITVPLFKADPDILRSGMLKLPAALPPPPSGGSPEAVISWLTGQTPSPYHLGIVSGLTVEGDDNDLMELEHELFEDPVSGLKKLNARPPCGAAAQDAAWCARIGYDLGNFDHTHAQAADYLARAIAHYLECHEPENRNTLKGFGADLVIGVNIAEAVAGVLDAEKNYLGDGPADTSGPAQNLSGSISPECDLSRPICLERAVAMHFSASIPLGKALRDAVSEFRIAQVMREIGHENYSAISQAFEMDPNAGFDELCELKTRNIVHGRKVSASIPDALAP